MCSSDLTLMGPLPGLEGWHPGIAAVLVIVVALPFVPYLRLAFRGAGIQRVRVHECGVDDLVPERTRVTAGSLFETPTALVRGLIAPSRRAPDTDEKHA